MARTEPDDARRSRHGDAGAGQAATAEAPTAADSIRFYLRSFGIATTQRVDSLIHDALAAKEEGRLLGRVVDQMTGRPIAGALLSLPTAERSAVTENDGRFFLGDVHAGRYMMDPKMSDTASAGHHRDPARTRHRSAGRAGNPGHRARADQRHGPLALARPNGFFARRTAGIAGHFFTRDEIEKKGLTQFTELFRDVPGVS